MTTAELLAKATADWTFTSSDLGGAGEAPLSTEQARQFIELMSADQVMLPDVRTVTSNAAKWQESGIDFAARIARGATQGERLASGDRLKPTTFIVELSTDLLRAEVPVADETFEDVAAEDLGGALERTIASRFGYDVEDLLLNGDTASGDSYLAQLDGWIKLSKGTGTNTVDATSYGADYETIFNKMIQSLPDRHKRNLEAQGRFYVPQRLLEKIREQRAARGTALGDQYLTGVIPVKHQGIEVHGVPALTITAATPDTSHILLTNRNNLYAGFQRKITFETFRDPREGATSFVVTARVAAAIAVVGATVIATGVDVEPS